MQVNPAILSRALLNQALINNQMKPKVFNRPPYKPVLKPKVPQPLKTEETLSKLEKLIPEIEDVDKFTTAAKELADLLTRGLNKETAPKFFEVLQKLSALIGSPAHNSVSLWRVFDGAYAKRTLFSTEQVDELTKWKAEVDAKLKPKTNVFVKRSSSDDQTDSNKKQRTNGASVEDILLKRIDTLEDEVGKLRDELAQTKHKYNKEIEQLRAHAGLPQIVDEEELQENSASHLETDTLEASKDVTMSSAVEQESSAEQGGAEQGGAEQAGSAQQEDSADLPNPDLNSAE